MQCVCGAKIIESFDDQEVRIATGEIARMRRRNDYIVCPRCFRAYSIEQLREADPLEGLPPKQRAEVAETFSDLSEDDQVPPKGS